MPRRAHPQAYVMQPLFGDPENIDGGAISFCSTRDAYGAFSNFAPYPITLKGSLWPTSEHYFQAQKFAGTPHEEEIRRVRSPMVAARMGRSRARPLRPDWDAVKDRIMHEAVHAKFTQHPALGALLLGTGEARIIEHTRRDRYWGDGDGSGLNKLGQILMRVRDELRAEL
jgi:N-glycosidase YbiA